MAARRIAASNAAVRGRSRTRAVTRTEEPGHAHIRTSASDRNGEYHSDEREVPVDSLILEEGEQPAFVRVGAGLTIPTGPYESLRIDVAVTLPCRTGEVEETYEKCSEFVVGKIDEEKTLWLGEPQKKGR